MVVSRLPDLGLLLLLLWYLLDVSPKKSDSDPNAEKRGLEMVGKDGDIEIVCDCTVLSVDERALLPALESLDCDERTIDAVGMV